MSQRVSGTEPVRLTHTSGLLSAPVRCGCIATGEHFGALQLVAGETAEVGFPAGVEVRHRDFPACWLFGECAAQHEGWRESEERRESQMERKSKEASLINSK